MNEQHPAYSIILLSRSGHAIKNCTRLGPIQAFPQWRQERRRPQKGKANYVVRVGRERGSLQRTSTIYTVVSPLYHVPRRRGEYDP
jgi:hypothetical protein